MSALRLFGDAVGTDARPARPARDRRPAPRPGRPSRRPTALRDRDCAAPPATQPERPRTLAREGRTLEDVISGAWEDLDAHRTTACPICAGELHPQHGSARCGDCGASLE